MTLQLLFARKVQIVPVWERVFKFRFFGSPILYDGNDESIYLSDCQKAPYSGMHLRKISIEDGTECASRSMKNISTAAFFDETGLLSWTGKRFLHLNRNDLSVIEDFSKVLPSGIRFASRMQSTDLFLHTTAAAFRYNVQSGRLVQIKVGRDYQCLAMSNGDIYFARYHSGEVLRFDPNTNEIKAIGQISPCHSVSVHPEKPVLFISVGRVRKFSGGLTQTIPSGFVHEISLPELTTKSYSVPKKCSGSIDFARDANCMYADFEPYTYKMNFVTGRLLWKAKWPKDFRIIAMIPEKDLILLGSFYDTTVRCCKFESE